MEGAVQRDKAAQARGFHVLQQGEYGALPRDEVSAQQAVRAVGVQQRIAPHEFARAEGPFRHGTQQHDLLAGLAKACAGVEQAVRNQLFQAHVPVAVDQFNPAVVDEYGVYLGSVFQPVQNQVHVVLPVRVHHAQQREGIRVSGLGNAAQGA